MRGDLKMQEIDKHLHSEARWWQGEGLSPILIAVVMRAVADSIDTAPKVEPSWAKQWETARPRYLLTEGGK